MSVHYDVPYYANPDDTHCVQAVFRMVIKYFTGAEPSWDELDEMSHKAPGKGTWLFPALVEFVRRGYEVVNIEPMDYERYLKEGDEYLREIYSQEAAEWYLENSNIHEVREFIPEFLETVHHQVREPTIKDVKKHLSDGCLVACDVNAERLYGKEGFLSHLVLVVGFENSTLYLNDPDAENGKDWPVGVETFRQALEEASADLTAFGFSKMGNRSTA